MERLMPPWQRWLLIITLNLALTGVLLSLPGAAGEPSRLLGAFYGGLIGTWLALEQRVLPNERPVAFVAPVVLGALYLKLLFFLFGI
jgi:hypothetical protein